MAEEGQVSTRESLRSVSTARVQALCVSIDSGKRGKAARVITDVSRCKGTSGSIAAKSEFAKPRSLARDCRE